MAQTAASVWLVMCSRGDGFVIRTGYAMNAAASDIMVAAFKSDDALADVYVIVLAGTKHDKGP